MPLAGPGVVLLADVAPTSLRWLWPGRVPLGKLTVLDGDPGLGKSAVTLDLAARVSRGDALPDGARGDVAGPAGVVLLCREDGLADTVRPRLEAAGADLRRVLAGTPTARGLAEVRRRGSRSGRCGGRRPRWGWSRRRPAGRGGAGGWRGDARAAIPSTPLHS